MKICYIVDGLRCGGRERQMYEMVSGFIRAGYLDADNFVIFSLGLETDFYHQKFRELACEIILFRRRFSWDIFILKAMQRELKLRQVDIIHTFDLMSSFYAALLKKSTGIKFIDGSIRIAPAHIKRISKTWLLSRFCFSAAHIIIANSLAGLRSFAVRTKGRCIYNGLDFDRFTPKKSTACLENLTGEKNRFAIVMVANFTDKKDYDSLVAAACRLRERIPEAMFIGIGEGIHLEFYRKIIEINSLKNVYFTGVIDNVEECLSCMNIGVLTSTNSEGISNSIMEYMAAGKPVIATRGGGTAEIVVDGETGFLIPPLSPELLADRILDLYQDQRKAAAMGRKGRERILEKFSLQKMLLNYLNLYKELKGGI